jgi:hypothetical protein
LLERYQVVDFGRKVVGVGSVGTRAWILLLTGRDGDDPLFLQAKEAEASVLEAFVGKSKFDQHGVPKDRLLSVLDHPDPFAFPWRNTRGLRFGATDVDWAKGRGPEVRGPGESIVFGDGQAPDSTRRTDRRWPPRASPASD